ncbi:MAG: hypothetical protein JW809_14850 [Pirellulales bacterium]|nr:hypothetical protein [Pirellulales bacterium]
MFTGILGAILTKLIGDAEKLRAFLQSQCDLLVEWAATTETAVDDILAKGLAAILASPEAWRDFHAAVLRAIHLVDTTRPLGYCETCGVAASFARRDAAFNDLVQAVADKTKLDLATILALIDAIMKLIDAWRNR